MESLENEVHGAQHGTEFIAGPAQSPGQPLDDLVLGVRIGKERPELPDDELRGGVLLEDDVVAVQVSDSSREYLFAIIVVPGVVDEIPVIGRPSGEGTIESDNPL